jgi:hypothetical protein
VRGYLIFVYVYILDIFPWGWEEERNEENLGDNVFRMYERIIMRYALGEGLNGTYLCVYTILYLRSIPACETMVVLTLEMSKGCFFISIFVLFCFVFKPPGKAAC